MLRLTFVGLFMALTAGCNAGPEIPSERRAQHTAALSEGICEKGCNDDGSDNGCRCYDIPDRSECASCCGSIECHPLLE
jgi:hypothetical protein